MLRVRKVLWTSEKDDAMNSRLEDFYMPSQLTLGSFAAIASAVSITLFFQDKPTASFIFCVKKQAALLSVSAINIAIPLSQGQINGIVYLCCDQGHAQWIKQCEYNNNTASFKPVT